MNSPDPKNRGNTVPTRQQEREPRLPHERDESADSQERHPDHERVGKQAKTDVDRGLVDTDRGPVIERANDALNKEKGG